MKYSLILNKKFYFFYYFSNIIISNILTGLILEKTLMLTWLGPVISPVVHGTLLRASVSSVRWSEVATFLDEKLAFRRPHPIYPNWRFWRASNFLEKCYYLTSTNTLAHSNAQSATGEITNIRDLIKKFYKL